MTARVEALGHRASNDYEAALWFVRSRPWDAALWNPRVSRLARLRRFGLGRGSIVYVPNSTSETIRLEVVSFMHSA